MQRTDKDLRADQRRTIIDILEADTGAGPSEIPEPMGTGSRGKQPSYH